MAAYRFPVLVWQDPEGWFTARLVERDEPAGIGRTAALALGQVQDYLDWRHRENPWSPQPDFHDPQLVQLKVAVRPEYEFEGRRFPCEESVLLRVYCVQGRQKHGLLIGALPTFDLRFYYYEGDALKGLVTHYVQQRLKGMTPQALSRYLPPAHVMLEEVVVIVRQRERNEEEEVEIPGLKGVAEPLGEPRVRRQFARPWERDREVADLVKRLGSEKANVLLVAEAGAGKTTVLVEAIRQLERTREEDEETQRKRPERRYWQTSGARIIAGMRYLGQWEERCEDLIAELGQIGGVLCVDNVLDLIREGGTSSTDSVAAFFLPYLQRGELRLVGEATPAELDACRRLLPGFADLFQILTLAPFERAQAVRVLDHLATAHQQNLHINVGRGVIDQVYHLFRRFAPYQAFPGKAAFFLTQVFERAALERAAELTQELVLDHFIHQTGLPELFLRDDLPLSREEVLSAFRSRVIGQEEACQAAANLVTTFKAGLNDPGRPVGVLLFCGPTGVGKTELARSLAKFFFGHGDPKDTQERLLRLDMSEYTGYRAAERLLTQPDGQPSELIKKVRQQPFVVLLLDEIEKADPEVFDVLLSVFDEGRLTDRFGRMTTFRSAVIVMTSNLGSDKAEAFGFGQQPVIPYEGEAMQLFRPEFFNRIDALVRFQPLGAETIRSITQKELTEIARREGIVRRGILLMWSEAVMEHLSRAGFDTRYGARPLQRTVETQVVAPLARYLVEHPEIRDTVVCLDLDDQGRVVLQPQ
jgi:ATP-dependent Clp protease ATP-binding subunit ClpC